MSGLQNGQRLKQLQTRKTQLEIELKGLNEDRRSIQDRIKTIKEGLSSVEAEMKTLQSDDLTVSEHALLRYLQRVKGIDLEAIKNEMLDNKTVDFIKQLGNGKYPTNNGCKLVVKNKTVVSVVSSRSEKEK